MLTASADSVNEGVANTFTVTASEAVTADTTVKFQLKIDGTGDTAQLADFNAGSFNEVTATILAGQTTATTSYTAVTNDGTELSEKYTVEATVAGVTTPLSKQVTILDGAVGAGQTFTLTTAFDQIPGLEGSNGNTVNSGDDIIVGTIEAVAANSTLNASDDINAGDGVDTLQVILGDDVVAANLPVFSNVETLKLSGSQDFGATGTLIDLSARTIENFTVASAGGVFATLADTVAVNVAGVTGDMEIDGGKNVVVSDATADNGIIIGAGAAAAGTITVTDTKQGTGDIEVDGGTTVNVTATVSSTTVDVTTGGDITIGAATPATGAVTVVQNLTSTGVAVTSGTAITVTGGTSVNVTVNATSTATAAGSNDDITTGTVTVTGDGETTAVTITQNATATTFTTPVVAEVADKEVVTFVALATGESVTVNGLTFTAAKALTADQVAAAFADLSVGDTQDNGGNVVNGTYTGDFDLDGDNSTDWTSGAASGATVTFTSVDDDEDALTISNAASVATAGTAGSGGVETSNVVALGKVVVEDDGTAAITTVTLDGYGASSTIGTANNLDAITTLSLANSEGDVTLHTDAITLSLSLDDIDEAVSLDGDGAAVEALTITTAGAASEFALTAAAVTDLVINAAVGLDISTSTMSTVLETVDVNGAGAVNLGDISSAVTLDSFNASGNTGGVTATVETDDTDLTGDITEYVFSEGNDTATLLASAGTVSQTKVTLGAGDDTADLSTGDIATLTEVIDGGTGTNTLKLTAAVAETATASATFEAQVTSFTRLSIAAASGQEVVDLANMDDISYVTLAGSTGSAQVNTITVGGTIEVGDVFSATVNGTTYSFTAASTTVADIVAGLRAAVNTGAPTGITVGAAGGTTFTLTAATAGVPFTASVATTEAGGTAADAQTLTNTPNTANAYGITLNNMANNGTVALTATGTVLVGMTDADGTTDVLNVLAEADTDVDAGFLTVNDVETVNVTATDSNVDEDDDGTSYESGDRDTSTLTLSADAATTVSVAGNGNVSLTTVAAALETVNATTMSGTLTYTASVDDLTVNAGTGADALTADADDVALYGNEGADTLTVNSGLRVNLYGGDGADTFVFSTGASATLDAYTVINGVTSGDTIKLTGGDSFQSTKIALSLGADESLLNYANQATKVVGEDDMGWFQKGGNTYIVMDTDNTDGDDFVGGTDMVIMLTGLVDLSTASYNITSNTLEIA